MLVFTNCGQTGNTGPSQGLCNSAYSGTSLAGLVTVPNDAGIQEWTVPQTGTYRIEVYGAEGGGNTGPGQGVKLSGNFSLTQGEVLDILIGQKGAYGGEFSGCGSSSAGGGGGGTFIYNSTTSDIIMIASGGGGAGSNGVGINGRTQTSGATGNGGAGGSGGSLGGGGGGGGGYGSGGGGGFCGDGGKATYNTYGSGGTGGSGCNNGTSGSGTICNDTEGRSFLNGGNGGGLSNNCYDNAGCGGLGGFGGGGAYVRANILGGGGGGYSGGGGGGHSGNQYGGGGGGSYIAPSATNVATSDGNYDGSGSFNGSPITNLNSYNSGHGQVIIYY